MRWLISASVFHIQEPVGLRLFPPFHPPAGLVHPWMPKDFMGLRGIEWESFAAEGLIKRCIV